MLELIGPDSTTVRLSQRRGGGGENLGAGPNDCSGHIQFSMIRLHLAISAGSLRMLARSGLSHRSQLSMVRHYGYVETSSKRYGGRRCWHCRCVQLEISRQRFVCCGVAGTPQIVAGDGVTVTAESYFPANNTPDPEETLTGSYLYQRGRREHDKPHRDLAEFRRCYSCDYVSELRRGCRGGIPSLEIIYIHGERHLR